MKKTLLFFTMLMVIVTLAFAQQRQVTGKVTGSDGAPIPFATVQIKGTNTGTTTDQNGNFKLNVTGNDVVFTVRSVGFTAKDVTVGAGSSADVVLESSSEALQEVVVTALGVQRKKNELPYSAQNVVGEDLVKVRESNLSNSLSGKVSGLEVRRNNSLGGSTNVVLRGNKSLSGNNQALFVVDGVPIDNTNNNTTDQRTGRAGYDYGNAAADINPDDIESLNVLKGAAATALYGSRAANGVIMITTKKGRRGLGVTVNSGVTIGKVDKSTFAKYQNKYGAGYGQYYGPDQDAFFNLSDIDGDGVLDPVVPLTEDASHGAPFDPNFQVYGWYSFDPGNPYYMKKRPWVAAPNDPTKFFQTAVSTINSVMVDGGGEQGYFKLGYTKNIDKGLLPNSSINKDQINFGASYNITPKLTASGSINATLLKGNGRYGTGYDSKNLMTNFRQWWQTNVDIYEQRDAYFRNKTNATWNQAGIGATNPIYWDNPYWTRYENFENDSRTRYFGNVALNYKLADWVDLLGRVSLDTYNELQEERIAVTSIDPSEYSRFDRKFSEYNYDLMANFHKKISSDFNLGGLIGTNVRRTRISSVRATTNGGLLIPRLYALLNTANPLEAPEEIDTREEVSGIFAAANLAYKEFLFLDITARRDQSSTLPKGNNSYYYPSVSLGFLFSKLMPNKTWLSHGKLRANYAEVGAPAPVLYTRDYFDVPTGIDGVPLASLNNTKYNPELKPERTKSWETGLEAAFLDNRVGFDVTYYNTRSLDQIVAMPVSRATGYDFKVVNAGEIQNKGVEVSAFGTPVKTPSFSWTVNVNWSRNRNKVKSLPEGVNNLQLGSMQGGVSVNAALNEPYGTIRGSNYVFNEKGEKLIGSNGYYVQSATSNEIIGNVNPDWIGGITNTVKYKDLSLSFLIDTRQGGDVFSLDMYYGLATGLFPETAGTNDLGNPVRSPISQGGGVILPGVKQADGKPNDIRVSAVNYGVYGYRRNPAAAFVYDASYVKLREVSLTYSLPRGVISKIHPIKGVDFSLIGRNLWIIHKNLPYADPEEGMSSGNVQGYQTGAYPTARTFGLNAKVRF
jgi:TonB-linked SusC/RagA family outer membrane protein